jgi:hypothetical protein
MEMELQIAFFATGVLIIIVGIFRLRNLSRYTYLRNRLEDTYAIDDIDLSGKTEYTNCFAQEWVYETTTLRKHGRVGSAFQSQLMSNTLSIAIVIGLFMGLVSVIIGMLFIRGIEAIGMAVLVIAVGLAIILGPGEPRVSEDLLKAMLAVEYRRLCENDYPYIVVAVNSIKKWGLITLFVGIAFIMITPFAEAVPLSLAWFLSFVSDIFFWQPALFLMEISAPIAIIYLASIIPILMYLVTKIFATLRKKLSRQIFNHEEEMYEEF